MTGFNHALVGGIIGKFVTWPLALPFALASHFLLDALPHYGSPDHTENYSLFWRVFFTIDFFATCALAVWALRNQHYAMYAAGQIAVLPDFMWVARVLRYKAYNFSDVTNKLARWHIKIQRYERPWGLAIEIPLSAALFYAVVLQAV